MRHPERMHALSSLPFVAPCIATVALALLLLPAGGGAQLWHIDSYAGQASYDAAPGADASRSGILGLRFNQDDRFFTATAAMPFSDAALAWGALALGDRVAFRRGGLVAGVDVSLLAHGQRDALVETTGHGWMAGILPMLSHNVGPAAVELRSGPRLYRAQHGEAEWDRTFWTTELRAGLAPGPGLHLEAEVRDDRGEADERYRRAGVSAATLLGPVAAHGSLGSWVDGPDDAALEWSLSLSMPVLERGRVFATARHESFDPHFLGAARTSWGIGASIRVGGSRAPAPAAGAESRESGRVIVRVPLRDAQSQPFIAGDFSNWEPVPMHRHGLEWRYTADLSPGVYRYAFRDRDGTWFVPAGVPQRVDDGMSGWNAILVVP
jgi:hypothetical protein